MLYSIPKNVYSLHLVSTLDIKTHPPRCCEEIAGKACRRPLVADKLANCKEPKEAWRGCAIAMGPVYCDTGLKEKEEKHSLNRFHTMYMYCNK